MVGLVVRLGEGRAVALVLVVLVVLEGRRMIGERTRTCL
jgi:hypothetical protein